MKFKINHNDFLSRFRNSAEFRKSIIYIISSSLGFGIVLIQNFSLAFFTSVPFFGKITLLISLFSTLYVIFTFGMNAVVMRYYFDKTYASQGRRLTSNIATLWFLIGILMVGVFLLLGYKILAVENFLPIDYYTEFIPILIGAFLFSSTEIFPNLFVAREEPFYYALALIGSRLTIFVLLHISIYFYGESSQNVSLMLLFSSLILFVASVAIFKLYSFTALSRKDLNEILRYAFPLMIYALGGIGYSHGYRVIISKWLTYEDLALFTMANQIAMVYYLTAASSVIGFQPRAYKALEEQSGHPRAIRFYFRLLLLAGLGLALVVAAAAYIFLNYFKDGSFGSAFKIVPVLLSGQFIYFLYGYTYILCTFYKKTVLLTYSMVAGVSTSLILTGFLLDTSSLLGAAVPVVCGILVQFLLSLMTINKVAHKAALRTW